MLSDHSGLKQEAGNRKTLETAPPNAWRWNNRLLHNTQIKEEVSRVFNTYFELSENENEQQ